MERFAVYCIGCHKLEESPDQTADGWTWVLYCFDGNHTWAKIRTHP